MKTKLSLISSALVGIIFGVLSNYSFLNGTWFDLAVWALVAILIGAFIEQKRFIRRAGLCYGFFLVATFLALGFHGTSNRIEGFALLSLGLSIVGALCGWVLAATGNWIKRNVI